jgi:hypothetical protein
VDERGGLPRESLRTHALYLQDKYVEKQRIEVVKVLKISFQSALTYAQPSVLPLQKTIHNF